MARIQLLLDRFDDLMQHLILHHDEDQLLRQQLHFLVHLRLILKGAALGAAADGLDHRHAADTQTAQRGLQIFQPLHGGHYLNL